MIDDDDGLQVLADGHGCEPVDRRDGQDRLDREARQRAETRLQQSQRLESLGQLAGGIAHDFNNLLGVITNYTAFVMEEIEREVVDDPNRWLPVADDLKQVARAARRAAELTHQLLAFGRRDAARPRVVDLNAIVDQLVPMLRRTLGEHIVLETRPLPTLWTTKADPGQLEQVLVNLALNARDAMPEGGRLTIETANLDVATDGSASMLLDGEVVALRVSDTGSGMSADVRARAFEPFFTTKARGAGSGLGLATVYGIVTQAGGDVHLDSRDGAGTTVTVVLPRCHETATVNSDAEPGRYAVPSATILLVEDEPAMRGVTRRMLERSGHYVITAGNGPDAIAAAQCQGQIDLLLTDVVMPEMLGKAVAAAIRQERPDLKVLFMSGYAKPALASQGTLDGDAHLLEKPFTPEQLAAKVSEVLGA